jgi:histidinol-phosphate aminotransferase
MTLRLMTESQLAWAELPKFPRPPKDAILINANENPLGPCAAARTAVADIIPQGGRYRFDLRTDLLDLYCKAEGLQRDTVRFYPGSTNPLHFAVVAFTSPQRSYVTADPGYEAGMGAADHVGARVVKVPLTSAWAHDVRAMLAAAPDAGLFYICTPNNPTGTLTSHADIEYLVANKPKGSVVMVDEAYIHFSDASSAIDLVKAGQDVIVLRTFSKLYGMAGLRCGVALARPDLLAKLDVVGGENPMPVTALVAASASLQDAGLVPERKRMNATVRQQTFAWLDSNGYRYTPSVSNCFLVETKRKAQDVIAAMQTQKVYIGRVWPAMPTWVRITVGTQDEMDHFQTAFQKVMTGVVSG